MHSTTDISGMVKQANILARLARGAKGAIGGSAKGALIGGALGAAAAPFTGLGLAGALGVGGAGMFSGAMTGGAIRGTVGGLRGLLGSRSGAAMSNLARSPATSEVMARGIGSRLPGMAIGAGAGYMLGDEDSKLLSSSVGALGGILAQPTLMRALERRAGGL